MKRLAIALTALSLAAGCSPPPPESASVPIDQLPIQAAGCNAQAARDWSAVGSQYYVIEAEAHGPTCGEAIATIRIKSRDGAVLFTRDYPTAEVPLAFSPHSGETGLRIELDAWAQNAALVQTADWLPAWPSGAPRPPRFQPEVSRTQYESARGAQGPLFCFPDGGESNACIAMAGNRALLLGSLTPERL